MEVKTEQPGCGRYKANGRGYTGVIAQLALIRPLYCLKAQCREAGKKAKPCFAYRWITGIYLNGAPQYTKHNFVLQFIHLHSGCREEVGVPFAQQNLPYLRGRDG